MARKKSWCKLIGFRFVIPHDTIPSNVGSNYNERHQTTKMAIEQKILDNYRSALIRKGNDPKTAVLYSKWLTDICNFHDITDPLTLDFEEIKEFIDFTIKRRPPNSVNTAFHSFIYFYNKINKKDYPFDTIVRPKRIRNTENVIFTNEELRLLFDAADKPKHKAALMLMYACGLDISELIQVLITDIDSTKNILSVRNNKGKKYREAPLPKLVINQLREYYKSEQPKKYLFENRSGEILNSRTIQHFFGVALKSSGIKKSATSKTLKYSYVKHLEKQGIPLLLILEHLGLKSEGSIYFYSGIEVDLQEKIKISPIDYLLVPKKVETTKLYSDFWNLVNDKIEKSTRRKFETGFYADAVETALKEINSTIKKIVKTKTGEELDGAKLMQKAFSIQNPILELADLNTESGRNIQQGYLQIFSGAMTGIRNPKAHDNIEIEIDETVRLLCFCGELMDKIENRIK
ncbi:MAG: TIGR02391 family protein [Bacteroidetes bacterium HGW-Bacteroidetes-3]|nr:MAG: TIGR02391 family protein [Bacteroidetes bacterium HGW-Bacteroidetes-3]